MKNKENQALDQIPTLMNVVNIAVETTMEILDKKNGFAFVNNVFATIGVMSKLPTLREDVMTLNEQPLLVAHIEAAILAKFGKADDQRLEIVQFVFTKVLSLVLINVSGGMEIDKGVRAILEKHK